MLKEIGLLIFDHSGVISDDTRPVCESNNLLLEEHGKSRLGFEDWKEASRASVGDFLESFGCQIDRENIFARYNEIYGQLVDEGMAPSMYEDVPHVLEKLKNMNIKLAIVSSHPADKLDDELNEYGISGYFDRISAAGKDALPKDGRLVKMCDHYDSEPKNVLFIEDTIYGLEHGRRAGVNCVGITTGYHSRSRLEAQNPHAVVDSLTEILEIID